MMLISNTNLADVKACRRRHLVLLFVILMKVYLHFEGKNDFSSVFVVQEGDNTTLQELLQVFYLYVSNSHIIQRFVELYNKKYPNTPLELGDGLSLVSEK
jgi:hypothetical protein